MLPMGRATASASSGKATKYAATATMSTANQRIRSDMIDSDMIDLACRMLLGPRFEQRAACARQNQDEADFRKRRCKSDKLRFTE
jgi:hypothetical protein